MNRQFNRRELLLTGKKTFLLALAGQVTVGCAATSYDSLKSRKEDPIQDGKEVFMELGTCSRTLFFITNRSFGRSKGTGELASDPLAGGIMQRGHQCGMLWGASLAAGAESYHRYENRDQAVSSSITATQHLIASFSNRTNAVNCRDITNIDFTSTFGLVKFMITGRFLDCFDLAEQWAPEAVQAANQGLSKDQSNPSKNCINCASEVARRMGASDEEMVMVAGFAGGLGMSGNACGALSAAIWMNTFAWCRANTIDCNVETGESPSENANATRTLNAFDAATDSEILCHKICGRQFSSIEAHSAYIKNGGCQKLIETLAQS